VSARRVIVFQEVKAMQRFNRLLVLYTTTKDLGLRYQMLLTRVECPSIPRRATGIRKVVRLVGRVLQQRPDRKTRLASHSASTMAVTLVI
jgi:23S rRNA A1618 N6-methylase RlmF